MTSSMALLCFNLSIYFKLNFEITEMHLIGNVFCIIFNIINVICNYILFGMSFSDYFEYKESIDFKEMNIEKKNE
jgi:hypothetical protein